MTLPILCLGYLRASAGSRAHSVSDERPVDRTVSVESAAGGFGKKHQGSIAFDEPLSDRYPLRSQSGVKRNLTGRRLRQKIGCLRMARALWCLLFTASKVCVNCSWFIFSYLVGLLYERCVSTIWVGLNIGILRGGGRFNVMFMLLRFVAVASRFAVLRSAFSLLVVCVVTIRVLVRAMRCGDGCAGRSGADGCRVRRRLRTGRASDLGRTFDGCVECWACAGRLFRVGFLRWCGPVCAAQK